MHYASEIEPGGMANVYIRPDSKLNYAMKMARDWCLDKGIKTPVCAISNFLNPESKVVAGHLDVCNIEMLNSINIDLFICSLGIKISAIKSQTVQSKKDADIKCFWSISH